MLWRDIHEVVWKKKKEIWLDEKAEGRGKVGAVLRKASNKR